MGCVQAVLDKGEGKGLPRGNKLKEQLIKTSLWKQSDSRFIVEVRLTGLVCLPSLKISELKI